MTRAMIKAAAVSGLLLVCGIGGPGRAAAADPVEVGDLYNCKACHVERLRELKKPKDPVLVDPASVGQGVYGEQQAASTSRMCLSCHDGFVEDARYVWSDGHSPHPLGIAPPEAMGMATIDGEPALPLNADGEVYCGTCHSGHFGEGAAAGAPTFLRLDSVNGQICSNCHADKAAIGGSPHAKLRKKNQPPDFERRGICGRCHAPHRNEGPLLWAKEPAGGNTPVNGLCRTCHGDEPSPAEHPVTVLAWSQPVREALIGDSVPEMPVFDTQARHASRGAIGCPTCHDPHRHRAEGLAEDVPGYFLRVADTRGFLCADCHASSSLMRYKFFHSEKSRR